MSKFLKSYGVNIAFILTLIIVLGPPIVYKTIASISYIKASVTDAPFSVSVLYPSGGQSFPQTGAVQASTKIISSKSNGIVSWYLIGENSGYERFIATDSFSPLTTNMAYTTINFTTDTPVGSDYKVKVIWRSSDGQEEASDTNNTYFDVTLLAPTILLSPNGGENWAIGTTQTVKWTTQSGVSVLVDLYKGNTYIKRLSANAGYGGYAGGSYLSVLITSDLVPGSDYKIKIQTPTLSINDWSDASFSIVAAVTSPVTVLSPNGGEQFTAGQAVQMPLQWSALCSLSSFNISLYKANSFVQTINSNIAAGICASNQQSTSYYTTWSVPLTLQPGSDYKIRITSGSYYDESDAPFSISSSVTNSCIDSDGGYYPDKFGSVEWIDRTGQRQKTDDICIDSSVMEAVCDQYGYANNAELYSCPNGCANGVCNTINSSFPGFYMTTDKKEYLPTEMVSLTLKRADNQLGSYAVNIYGQKQLSIGMAENFLIESNYVVSDGNSTKKINLNNTKGFTDGGSGEYLLIVCAPSGCTLGNTNSVIIKILKSDNLDNKPDLMILGVKTKKIEGLVEGTDSQVNIIVHYKNNSKVEITKPFYISVKTQDDAYYPSGFMASRMVERVIKPHENYSEVIGTYLYQKDKVDKIEGVVSAGVDIVYEDKNDPNWITNSNKIDESNENNNIIEKRMVINENSTEFQDPIEQIRDRAKDLSENKFDLILSELNQLRSTVKEQQNEIKYLKSLLKGVKGISESAQNNLNNFITYGVDENTKKLGERERAGVMDSYKSAFNKLPETEEELTDAIKIANGRFPSITNNETEKKAKEQFIKIYKRIADMSNAKDDAAVKVMAYGLRPAKRNLDSEKAGLSTFKSIYGHLPQSAAEWDAMRAITYSGTKRMPDADKDLLSDEMEQKLGTNPAKADTDGDGRKDGSEVNNNTDPLKK